MPDQTDPVDATEEVPLFSPALSIAEAYDGIVDDVDGSQDLSVGDKLQYTIPATNTGTANLMNVVVSDSLTTDTETCPGPLLPGTSCFTFMHSVIQKA